MGHGFDSRREEGIYTFVNVYNQHAAAAAAAAKSLQSCPILCDPIDSSPSGSPVPGILQARTLEWVAISFSIPLYICTISSLAIHLSMDIRLFLRLGYCE